MKKHILSIVFLTTLLSSCITIEDEADITINKYVIFQGDTIIVSNDTIK